MELVSIKAEMAGSVWKIEVNQGERVAEEDDVMIMESMKMEIPVSAPEDGLIKEIKVKEGDFVSEGDVIATLEV